eukprot:scaffold1869_cov493-Prasinococcus_capsulatus_cf.AAC.4
MRCRCPYAVARSERPSWMSMLRTSTRSPNGSELASDQGKRRHLSLLGSKPAPNMRMVIWNFFAAAAQRIMAMHGTRSC